MGRQEQGRASPELRSSRGIVRLWAGEAVGPENEEPSFGGGGKSGKRSGHGHGAICMDGGPRREERWTV